MASPGHNTEYSRRLSARVLTTIYIAAICARVHRSKTKQG